MALITVRMERDATLANAIERLGLDERDVDVAYGLVLIDPDQHLYALRVSEEAGTFADPKIEPYGPPKRSPD